MKKGIKREKPENRPNRTYKHFDDYLNTITLQEMPISEAGVEHLAHMLIDWSRDSKALIMNDFFDEFGVIPRKFYEWTKRAPLLKEAYEYALRRIGSNREYGALTRKFEPSMIRFKQHQYDPSWADADKYHANLKSNVFEGSGKEYIVIRESASSSLVPEKPKKDSALQSP
jgi:hypothetical protein